MTLVDRSVNPLEEGFDVAIGALQVSYPNVIDVPLCRYEIVLCCGASYLHNRVAPQHPTDLVDFDCLTSGLFSSSWVFESSGGPMSVEVHSRVHVSEARVLRELARRSAAGELRWLDPSDANHIAVSAVRPGRTALLHLRTLQALDGVLAGASHRELGAVFFGAAAIAKHWYDGSDLRAQVRRFVRRGRVLMLGGYRRLLQTDGPEKGRSH